MDQSVVDAVINSKFPDLDPGLGYPNSPHGAQRYEVIDEASSDISHHSRNQNLYPPPGLHSKNEIDWNTSNWPAPSLDINDIHQTLDDFERFCNITQMPINHRQRLLLTELKRCSNNAFVEFLRIPNTGYPHLLNFIRGRFETSAPIHNLVMNPKLITMDTYSQFARISNLLDNTPKEELIKFLVMKTSPITLQEQMEGALNLPYQKFYNEYKAALTRFNRTKRFYPQGQTQNSHDMTRSVHRENTFPQNRVSDNRDTWERFPSRVKAPTRENLCTQDLCSYHIEYGHAARNCNKPDCKMRPLVEQAVNDFQLQKNAMGRKNH